VELSEVLSPLSPGLWRSIWEAGLSGSWETLKIVRRAVLLGVELSKALSPLSPGLVCLGRASRLWVAILLSVEVSEALSPFGPSYERGKKTMIRYTPTQRLRIIGKESYSGPGQGVE